MIINPYIFATAGGGLTEYPSGIDFAISVREIPGLAWTGAIFKVRRSSDNAELTFYQGTGEYNWNTTRGGGGTDLETWIGANTGYVTEWYRQDGSGGKMAQTTSGSQPRIISAGTLQTSGGYPAVWFDKDSFNLMVIDGTGLPSNAVPYTHMFAGNRVASATAGLIMSKTGNTNGFSLVRWTDNYVYQRSTDGQDQSTGTSTAASLEVLAAWATSTAHSMDTHAGNIASGHTETAYSSVGFDHYARWDSIGAYGNCKIIEHVYYNGEARSDYQDIIDFMASEFGL